MIGHKFVQRILWILIVTFCLGTVPLFGKYLKVVKSIDAIIVEDFVRLYESGVFVKFLLLSLAQLLERDLHLGQEIYTFFNKYGGYGLIGLIISIALISTIISSIFRISILSLMSIT